eukprot:s2761_g5.t1
MPLISDVSEGARVWWTRTVQKAQDAYTMWLTAGPIDRMAVQPNLQVETKYERLESRVLSMLLASVPQTVKQEAISLREMTCVQLVFRILKLYQPGGLNEKSTILSNLTQTTAAKSASEAGEMLRQWRRQLLRARELGLHVPDPLLQADHLHHGTTTKASPASNNPKVNYVNAAGDKGGGKKGSPGKNGNVNKPDGGGSGGGAGVCKHWGSSAGCLKGDKCTYAHDWNNLNDKDIATTFTRPNLVYRFHCTAGEKSTASPGDKSSKGSPKGKGKSKDGKKQGQRKGP